MTLWPITHSLLASCNEIASNHMPKLGSRHRHSGPVEMRQSGLAEA